MIKNQTSKRIKCMVNDNGGKYTSSLFTNFVKDHGICMLLTAPYTPQQNHAAEIGNRTTTEKARALLKHAGLLTEFWGEAVSTAVYLENRRPVASRGFISPFKLWHGYLPSYNHLRVFGCLAYVRVGRKRRQGNFADTAKRGVFVGYPEGHHNYRVWLLDKKRVVYSHDVVFVEDDFPLKGSHKSFNDSTEANYLMDNALLNSDLTTHELPTTQVTTETELEDEDLILAETADPSSVTPDSIVPHRIVEGDLSNELDHINPSTSPLITPQDLTTTSLTSSSRPVAVKNVSSAIDIANILPNCTRRAANVAHYRPSPTSIQFDPTTYAQAMAQPDSDEWSPSINCGLGYLEAVNIWEEVMLPKGEHALGTTWVFKRKTGLSGELLKYKARLCAQGYSQIKGVDYLETYAPTGRLTTLQTALSASAMQDLEVIQMDSVGAESLTKHCISRFLCFMLKRRKAMT